MSASQNMATIRAWVDAINRSDVAAELACWQPDGQYVLAPTGTTYQGTAQLREAGRRSASVIAGQPVHGRKQISYLDAGENWACVTYDASATIEGPLVVEGATVLPAGVQRPIHTKACVVFQMRHGKISRATEYFDTTDMAAQLGIDHATVSRLYGSLPGPPQPTDTAPTPADVVAAFIEAWNNKDLNGIRALLAPQVTGRNPLSAAATLTQDSVCAAIEAMMASFPDLHMRIDTIISDDATVAVEEFETATLAATNRSYAMPVSLFIRVNPSGQIEQLHNYWDTQSYFDQLQTTPQALAEMLTNRPGSGAHALSWQGWGDAQQRGTEQPPN